MQSLRFTRLTLLRLLACCLIALGANVQAEVQQFASGVTLKKYGTGELRKFGFLVYDAVLWAGTNPVEAPLALQLTYKRDIAGQKIVDASVREMRELGAPASSLPVWGQEMSRIFPNVRSGDQITGLYLNGSATFLLNNREIGRINDPEFARYFFGIWLDPRTSEPKLRSRLLQSGTG
jgi:Chalcone isomerase-like